jgi:ArsR family transcriptional regulator
MSPDSFDSYAGLFKLLGHPVRLQILDVLRRSPECVCHLEAVLHKPQPYISQQLRVLREAGVIEDSKDGLNVFYHLVHPAAASLLNAALGPVLPTPTGTRTAVPACTCPKCAAITPIQLLER